MLEGRIIKLGGKKVLSSESDGLNPYQSNPEKRWSRAGIPTQKDRDVPKQLAATGAYWVDKGEFAECMYPFSPIIANPLGSWPWKEVFLYLSSLR